MVCSFEGYALYEVIWESGFCRLTAFLLCDLKRCERADLEDGWFNPSRKSGLILVYNVRDYENNLL